VSASLSYGLLQMCVGGQGGVYLGNGYFMAQLATSLSSIVAEMFTTS